MTSPSDKYPFGIDEGCKRTMKTSTVIVFSKNGHYFVRINKANLAYCAQM